MTTAISPSLELQALNLASKFVHAQEFHLRSAHTETMWQYRTYEGGTSCVNIDWRQSAKGRDILVREHEKIERRHVYFCASFQKAEPDREATILLLLVLAHLLVKNERQIGWLGENRRKTQTISQITGLFEAGLNEPICAHPHKIYNSFIIFMANLSNETDALQQLIRLYAAQGNRGIFIYTGDKESLTKTLVSQMCEMMEWPVFHFNRNDRFETSLLHLFEKSIHATR